MYFVGLSPQYNDETGDAYIRHFYTDVLIKEGVTPVIIPLTDNMAVLDEFISLCDAFLMTGGQDVEPSLYGEEKRDYCQTTCPKRDIIDSYLLKKIAETDKPVFGICRGFQIMNAVFGGTLYQDLAKDMGTKIQHPMDKPYDRVAHTVCIEADSPLAKLYPSLKIGVNSCHHQGIKTLAEGFSVAARAEDGLVEAIYRSDKDFVVAVQWHPEFFYEKDENSRILIKEFVRHIK